MSTIIENFLKELSKNNNREWFTANKIKYETAKNEFIKLITLIHKEISSFDNDIRPLDPRQCMFRIYRDVRFSKDKSPYKTNFGAFFNKHGKKIQAAGYYFHVEPGNCFLSGGMYMPPADILKPVRQEVFYNFDEFKKIISDKKFITLFLEIQGDSLQKVPIGFPKDFTGAEYLKYKDYYVMHPFRFLDYSEKALVDHAATVYKTMKPLIDFLNRAISD